MAPILYQDLLSPPVQACALTVRKAGLESVVKSQTCSLANGDHMKPEFVKKFPMHAVPALEDDGFYLWDSHAICPYMISAYAKDDTLYPKDPKKRAKVDQWLHFSNSILYVRLRAMSEPLWTGLRKDVPDEKKEHMGAGLQILDDHLAGNQWLCGDNLTVADICSICQVMGSTALYGDISKFKNVCAWRDRCAANLPGYKEICEAGLATYKTILSKFLA